MEIGKMPYRIRIYATAVLWCGAFASIIGFALSIFMFYSDVYSAPSMWIMQFSSVLSLFLSGILFLETMLVSIQAIDGTRPIVALGIVGSSAFAIFELFEMSGVWLRLVFGICIAWQGILLWGDASSSP